VKRVGGYIMLGCGRAGIQSGVTGRCQRWATGNVLQRHDAPIAQATQSFLGVEYARVEVFVHQFGGGPIQGNQHDGRPSGIGGHGCINANRDQSCGDGDREESAPNFGNSQHIPPGDLPD
jgi:hypothetical protein